MKNLMEAISKFQQDCPAIKKSSKGYNYTYADLPSILEVINPLLKKHGLAFTQPLIYENGQRFIKTTLFHIESGEQIFGLMDIADVKLAKMNDYQSLGSGITYIRRYALSSILGIATEEDTDAQGEQAKTEKKASKPEKVESPVPELPWLNENTESWHNAVSYLKGEFEQDGVTDPNIFELEKRFRISRASKEKLMNQSIS